MMITATIAMTPITRQMMLKVLIAISFPEISSISIRSFRLIRHYTGCFSQVTRIFFSRGQPVNSKTGEGDSFVWVIFVGLVETGDAVVGQHGEAGIRGWAGLFVNYDLPAGVF
jgi:hypothetical protein